MSFDLKNVSPEDQAKIRRMMIKSYLPMYASELLRGPPEYKNKFILGKHHLDWGDAIRDSRRILALAARDHGKSHMMCLAYPLWMAHVHAPGRLGYIFSATDQQAREHLDKIRKEIIGGGEQGGPNPYLKSLLPFKKDSARVLRFANGSEIRARGFGSRVRGGHPFWVVCDDILNDDHIWSDTVRMKSIDYYLSAIEPMVVPKGQIIVVGTPFHSRDLYDALSRSSVYTTMKHPAVVDDKPLWPERYDLKSLEVRKKVLGSTIRWSREYLCEPISDDSSLFPSNLFDAEGIKLPYSAGMSPVHWRKQGYSVFIGVDLAISASARADYFVAFVIAVDPATEDRWVVDIYRDKGLGYQRQVDVIVSLAKDYDAQFVFVEANQYQRVISDMVVKTSDVPIKAFYTTGRAKKQATNDRRGITGSYSSNKNALDRGVPGLRMLLENKKLHIPWAEDTRDKIQVWIDEMQAFGFSKGKLRGVGAHDDTVLAFWMADQAARIGGAFKMDFGEDLSKLGEANTPDWISGLGIASDPRSQKYSQENEIDWFGQNQFNIPDIPQGGWLN